MPNDFPAQIAIKDKAAFVWISMALLIGILCLLAEGSFLHARYMAFAKYAPGTMIRPILETTWLFFWSAMSVIAGSACAIAGLVISLRRKNGVASVTAFLAGIIAWLPLFVGHWGINYIMTLRGLVWTP